MILTILFPSGPSRPTFIDQDAMKIYSFEKRGATKRECMTMFLLGVLIKSKVILKFSLSDPLWTTS